MDGGSDSIVLFGRHAGARFPYPRASWGGIHMAIVPVPHRGQWTAECGRTMPVSDSLAVLHGAIVVDSHSSRACYLPPGVHMEDVCYLCMRRAGATHVIGMWRDAPPPRIAQIAPLRVRRGRTAPRHGRPRDR